MQRKGESKRDPYSGEMPGKEINGTKIFMLTERTTKHHAHRQRQLGDAEKGRETEDADSSRETGFQGKDEKKRKSFKGSTPTFPRLFKVEAIT